MLIPVSQIRNSHKGVEMIGDTLFVDGSPHKVCLRCGAPVKQFEGECHTQTKGVANQQKKQRAIEPYKIVFMLIKWVEEYILDANGNASEIVRKERKIIRSGSACFDCWNVFQLMKLRVETANKQNGTNKIAAFSFNDLFDHSNQSDAKIKPLAYSEWVERLKQHRVKLAIEIRKDLFDD
jgi:predicted nucleic acid-binding Zn ribbon protein